MTRDIGLTAPCCGSANYTEEELLTIVRAYAESGLQFACHVQGDAATDRILNVYETVLTERGMLGTDHRWRLEHCGMTTKAQFERAASLGVTCSMFVRHVYYFGDTYVDDLLGRIAALIGCGCGPRSMQANESRCTATGTSRRHYPSATSRRRRPVSRSRGAELRTDERITIDEALQAITINAAWHLFSEHEVGSIEVGKFADFTELSTDPYDVEPHQLEDQVSVLGTWINGRRVEF